jgi:hypothetical protein
MEIHAMPCQEVSLAHVRLTGNKRTVEVGTGMPDAMLALAAQSKDAVFVDEIAVGLSGALIQVEHGSGVLFGGQIPFVASFWISMNV